MPIQELTSFETQKLIVGIFGHKTYLKQLAGDILNICDSYPLKLGEKDGIRVIFKYDDSDSIYYIDTYNNRIKLFCANHYFSYSNPMPATIEKAHGYYHIVRRCI